MKITYPKFTPVTKETKHPYAKMIAILYHSIIPMILVYVSFITNNFLWLIPVAFILFIRLPEENT